MANGYRYERKYPSEVGAGELRAMVLSSKGMFREVFYKRKVISLYFDTQDLMYYKQNELDQQQRKKVRARWYEPQSDSGSWQVEIKIRDGSVARKIGEKIERRADLATMTEIVRNKLRGVCGEAFALEPVLVNSYQREYFYSPSTDLRITIDSDLQFYSIKDWQLGKKNNGMPTTVLECKYQVKDDKALSEVCQDWPMRAAKFSKYVEGIKWCYAA